MIERENISDAILFLYFRNVTYHVIKWREMFKQKSKVVKSYQIPWNLDWNESRIFLKSNGKNGIQISGCVATILVDAKEIWMKLNRLNE